MTKAKNSAFNKVHFEENKTMHRNYNSNHDISNACQMTDTAKRDLKRKISIVKLVWLGILQKRNRIFRTENVR